MNFVSEGYDQVLSRYMKPGVLSRKNQIYMWSSPHNALRRIMRILFVTIVVIAVLISACFFSACISPFAPANQTEQMPPVNVSPTIDVGVVPLDMAPGPEYISFEEARGDLLQSDLLSLNSFQNTSRILFIEGGNLDNSGNAERWVFWVKKGETSELRIYDRSGWTIIPWNSAISGEEIHVDRIVSPGDIFKPASIQIPNTTPSTLPVQRDLSLRNGVYRVTITSGSSSQILIFNATTGAPIEYHDLRRGKSLHRFSYRLHNIHPGVHHGCIDSLGNPGGSSVKFNRL